MLTRKDFRAANAAELAPLRKQIHGYARDYAKALFAGEVPAPSGGDCWDCLMSKDAGGHDHLRSHMSKDERYFVPSLIVNAAEECGNGYLLNFVLPALWAPMTPEERERAFARERGAEQRVVCSVLCAYIGRRLGLALR